MTKKPYFITIEGIEGAGKSTAVKFIHQYLSDARIPHIVTREPGGTEIAEEIRQLLLKHYQESMAMDTELLLMFASRAQHLATVINPALQSGKWVICDRFTDATYAYQGGGRGIDMPRIAQIEQWVQKQLRPDLVLLFDVPVEIGLKRIKKRQQEDRIEQEKAQFFERIRQVYLARASDAANHYTMIDASLTWPQVRGQLEQVLEKLLRHGVWAAG
jgi:dTMP kinase